MRRSPARGSQTRRSRRRSRCPQPTPPNTHRALSPARTRRPPGSCPDALHLKVACRSVSPAGETDLMATSRVVRDPQAAIFFSRGSNPSADSRPQTPDPRPRAVRVHTASPPRRRGYFPQPVLSPHELRRQERSQATAGLVAGLSAASEGFSSGKVKQLLWDSYGERRGAGRGLLTGWRGPGAAERPPGSRHPRRRRGTF